jgi:lysophospholipase L1-like esterase
MNYPFLIVGLLLSGTEAMTQSLSRTGKVNLLALGDSYTIGESVAEDQRWPMQLIHYFQQQGIVCEKPTIIARTGWRTDDLTRAISAASLLKNYTLVSLLIGVNNQYQGKSITVYATEFEELLKTAILYAAGNKTRVFVISIPDYGFTPFGKEKQPLISNAINEFNTVNKSITEKYGILYCNITDISRRGLTEPDLVAEDGLHPSGKMYAAWVERIASELRIKK